jgi:hypothetical protein
MPKFIVTKREVWTQGVEVDANNEADAIRKVDQGDGEIIESLFEYGHSLKADQWTAEEK